MTIPNILPGSKKPTKSSSSPSTISKGIDPAKSVPAAKTASRDSDHFAFCRFLFYLIVASFGIAAATLYTNHSVIYTEYSGYHYGDQILASRVADSYSSILCQTYSIGSWSDGEEAASYYLTEGPARISPRDRQLVVITNSGLYFGQEYDYRGFYLLPGSLIEASACMNTFTESPTIDAQVLFIQGDDHFTQWTRDASCANCVAQRITITPERLCAVGKGEHMHLEINHADTYYVVITRQHRSWDDAAFRANVTIEITKTVYNVSNAKQKCLDSTFCTFDLAYNSDDDIIVEFPFREFPPEDPDNSFRGVCGLRTKFFLIVFVAVPGSLLFLITLVSCIYYLRSDKHPTNDSSAQLQKKKEEAQAILVTTPDRYKTVPPV